MADQPLSRLSRDEILSGLLEALSAERQAEADYQAHAESCRRLGEANDLAETFEALCDVERDHAQRLTARIVELGGSPSRQMVQAETGGERLAEWLVHDLRGEQWAIVHYAHLIGGSLDDDESAGLLTELLFDELRHARWLAGRLRAQESG